MHFSRMMCLVLGIIFVTAGCGTGFVDGWSDNEKQGSGMTPAEYCKSKGGHTWINGSCQKNTGFDLTQISEDQCKDIENAFWLGDKCRHYYELNESQCASYDNLKWHGEICDLKAKVECEESGKWYEAGECLERPILTLSGALEQNLVKSAQMEPVELGFSEGSLPSIKSTTCEGFFAISEGKLISNADYKIEDTQKSCVAKLVSVKRTVQSLIQTVTINFSEGFLSYCSDPKADIQILNLVWILMDELKAPDCATAMKSLSSVVSIQLVGDNQISRLEALSGLRNIRKVEIRNHLVEDVKPLSSLTNLGWLDLRNGKISDISALASLEHLRFLNLEQNPIAVKANKTEANCPTSASTNEAVRKFCLDK